MTMRDVFGDGPALVNAGLRGYRSWGACTTTGRLRSTGMHHFWREDAARSPEIARCLAGQYAKCDEAPGAKCGCGLYGWYAPDDQKLVTGSVFGAVEITGRVQLGTHGFRAERARVEGVWTPVPTFAELLADRGHRVFESREQLLAALPPHDVRELVEHRCAGPSCASSSMAKPSAGLFTVAPTLSLGWGSAAAQAAAGAGLQVALRRIATALADAQERRSTPVLRRE